MKVGEKNQDPILMSIVLGIPSPGCFVVLVVSSKGFKAKTSVGGFCFKYLQKTTGWKQKKT